MCCILYKDGKDKQTMKRIAAIMIAICFVMASFFATVNNLGHIDHCHDHDHSHNGTTGICMACDCIKKAENLRQTGTTVKGISLSLDGLCTAMAVLCAITPFRGIHTLINLKVRIDS